MWTATIGRFTGPAHSPTSARGSVGGGGGGSPPPGIAGRNARMCVLPASASAAAVAVLTPVAPVVAMNTRLPATDWPVVFAGPLSWSNDSAIPAGGVQVLEEAKVWEVTSIVFATVV